jgi:hypothetical protein
LRAKPAITPSPPPAAIDQKQLRSDEKIALPLWLTDGSQQRPGVIG